MNRLKKIRQSQKYTLRELEELSGIARSTLSEIENKKRRMGVTHAERLAPILKVSVDSLIGTDAIKVVDSFEDALENLFVMVYDDIMLSIDDDTVSNRHRYMVSIVDQLLHRNYSDEQLSLILNMFTQLGNKPKDQE